MTRLESDVRRTKEEAEAYAKRQLQMASQLLQDVAVIAKEHELRFR